MLGLAVVFGIVLLIFLYQAICGKHVENEFEKRKELYLKEDQNIRQTIKHRKTTQKMKENRIAEANQANQYESVNQKDADGEVGMIKRPNLLDVPKDNG